MVESRASREIGLPAAVVFDRLTALRNHERLIPLTTIEAPDRRPEVGDVAIATSAGFLRDTMELVAYRPPHNGGPGSARWVKRGPVLLGEAEIVVTPAAVGCRVDWIERDIMVRGLPLTRRPLTSLIAVMTRVALARLVRLSDPPRD